MFKAACWRYSRCRRSAVAAFHTAAHNHAHAVCQPQYPATQSGAAAEGHLWHEQHSTQCPKACKPSCPVQRVAQQLKDAFDIEPQDCLHVSAKTGERNRLFVRKIVRTYSSSMLRLQGGRPAVIKPVMTPLPRADCFARLCWPPPAGLGLQSVLPAVLIGHCHSTSLDLAPSYHLTCRSGAAERASGGGGADTGAAGRPAGRSEDAAV